MDNSDLLSIVSMMLPVFVLSVALIVEKFVPIAAAIDPLKLFHFICQSMANKVLKHPNDVTQSKISGALALLVLLLPVLIIAYLVHAFADYKWLIDILLLWVLLQFRQDVSILNKGIEALQANKKLLAKNLLQKKLLRNTLPLSSLGLVKAGAETVLLRYHHQQFVTILCYLLFGPIAALCYRLCYVAQQVWNTKLTKYQSFGKFAGIITLICQSIPSIVFSFTFIVVSKPTSAIKVLAKRQYWCDILATLMLKKPQHLLLNSLSTSTGLNTGGPLQYNQVKQQRCRFYPLYDHSHQREPKTSDFSKILRKINMHLLTCMLIFYLIRWIVI